MMARKRKGLTERHKKILLLLSNFQEQHGYPPTIRQIGENTNISSTSVVTYYLKQLEDDGLIERDPNVSRGVRIAEKARGLIAQGVTSIQQGIDNMVKIPLLGPIAAGLPMPVPGSDFARYDEESMVDVARSLLPTRENPSDLFALTVKGDSMIDAMINDGDIVIMKTVKEARNGEMVAVWLNDKDETTLKYFYHENGRVRLQPANPTMKPIYINDPTTVDVQGKVVMVIRQMQPLAA